ncbi:unnamed protein product [Caenorhabditis brenneri]
MRRFTLLTLRNMGVGRDVMEEKIMEELDARCEDLNLQAVDGTTIVNTSELFNVTVGSIINSMLVGKRFDEHNRHEFDRLQQLVHDSGEVFTPFDLTTPVWILKYFFPKRYGLLMDSMLAVNEYVAREAKQRFEDLKDGLYELDRENPNDFVDAFLAKMEKNEDNPAYSMKSLEFVLADLWSAGQDTTSTTLTSGFNQLVNNPEVIKKVREELLKVTDNGSRPLSLKDKTRTPYFNATLAEIQRCASIGNVSLWKTSEGKTTVNGYELGDGVILTSQLGALHINEDVFETPEKFYPERYIENEKLLQQLIPFGIGKRSCIGENLARSELYLIIGNLLLRYDIKAHGHLPETKDQMPYTSLKQPDRSGRIEFRKF